MSLRLITAATDTPVSLSEAKAHLRVTDSAEDTLITSMITSAAEVGEQHTGRAFMPQTWALTLDSFADGVVLTRPPVRSITSITYVDTVGVTQTIDPVLYRLRNSDDFGFAVVVPAYGATWPATLDDSDVITVTFVCGNQNEDFVPEPIKAWIKLQVGAMYENREGESYSARAVSTTVKMSFVDGLLNRYKVFA
jgi:uncharacterized phiE125 gp8 family phage protein